MVLKRKNTTLVPVTPPANIPPGYVGPVALPGTGREVYWTGRVAIGLTHSSARNPMEGTQAVWLQKVLTK